MLYVSEIQQVTQYTRLAIVTDSDTGEEVGRQLFGDSISERWVREMAPLIITKPKKKRRNYDVY